MASDLYNKVHVTLQEYIGKDKADLALNRQLDRCSATEDNFSAHHLKLEGVMNGLLGVCSLYLNGEDEKLKSLTGKIQTFV